MISQIIEPNGPSTLSGYKVVIVGLDTEWSAATLQAAGNPSVAFQQAFNALEPRYRASIDSVLITRIGKAVKKPIVAPEGAKL